MPSKVLEKKLRSIGRFNTRMPLKIKIQYRHMQSDFKNKDEVNILSGCIAGAVGVLQPDPGSRYTAWSSMGTLIKKQLVTSQSSPAR